MWVISQGDKNTPLEVMIPSKPEHEVQMNKFHELGHVDNEEDTFWPNSSHMNSFSSKFGIKVFELLSVSSWP